MSTHAQTNIHQNILKRAPSPGGVLDLEVCWPPHPKRKGFAGPVGNQRLFGDVDILPHMYRLFMAGIGSGKTLTGATTFVEAALENPDCTGLVVSRDLKMCKKVQIAALELVFDETARKLGHAIVQKHNRSDQFYTLINGFTIYYTGSKLPIALRGPNITLIWWDEPNASDDPHLVYKILSGRFRGEGTRTIRRQFLVTGTPAGKVGPMMHWATRCKRELLPGVFSGSGVNSNYLMVKMRTKDNDALPEDYERDRREHYDPMFARQELDGEMVDLEGKVFSDVYHPDLWPRGNHTRNFRYNPQQHEMHVAIDWGLQYPHVLWIAHIPGNAVDPNLPTDVIVDEFCKDGAGFEEIIAVLKAREKKWGRPYDAFYPDPSGRQENRELKSHFRDVEQKKYRQRDLREIRFGIFVLRGRLKNGYGARRMLIHGSVLDSAENRSVEGRGIANALSSYDYSRTRDGKAKVEFKDDSWYVHGVDTLRYYTTHQYPGHATDNMNMAA